MRVPKAVQGARSARAYSGRRYASKSASKDKGLLAWADLRDMLDVCFAFLLLVAWIVFCLAV